MKLLSFNRFGRYVVLALLLVLPWSGFARKKGDEKKQPYSSEYFLELYAQLPPDAGKEDVVAVFGPPYKVAFVVDGGRRYEQLSYRVETYQGEWLVIAYNFVFRDARLVALLEDERTQNDTFRAPLENHLSMQFLTGRSE